MNLRLILTATLVISGLAALAPALAQTESKKTAFPTARECAARMTVPPGFVVKAFASEPEIVNPIAIDFDHQGRVYILECLTYPRKAPAGKGRDRIKVLDDTDGDGVADRATTFAEGLNLATGLAVGYGGVFVGQAPELLFLEDTDGDGKADKRTILLDGWGHQDTHETLNSFIWGPDGWLYGCHGVFTHSRVGKPGAPDKDRVPLNAGIWRYHPRTQKFELWSEGTSNPWGFDYDENGSGFLTACVIPHLFHMVPGGLYVRQAGQNFNPYAYGQIREICDHVHYFGVTPHSGNKDPRSLDKGGGHAHAGCLIYQGGAYPEEWNGRVFMNNIHGGRINTDILKRNGSSYIGSHGPDFLVANDPNFRVIQLRTGPDGSIYMIDWYDPQICHNTDAAIWDRSHGRVYKVEYQKGPGIRGQGPQAQKPLNVGALPTLTLVELLKHPNSWWWRKALLALGERGDKSTDPPASVVPALEDMARKSGDYRHGLRALWALAYLNAFDEKFGAEILGHKEPWLRAWAVRLLGQQDRPLQAGTWSALQALAQKDPSPDVLLQLASLCQRSKGKQPRDTEMLVYALLTRGEFLADPTLPVMCWLAFEPVAFKYANGQAGLVLFAWGAKNPDPRHASPLAREYVLPRLIRRWASDGGEDGLNTAVGVLKVLEDPRVFRLGIGGLLEAVRGRRLPQPPKWGELRDELLVRFQDDQTIRPLVERLGIHFGDKESVAVMEKNCLKPELEPAERIQAVQALGLARQNTSIRTLIQLAGSDAPRDVKAEAMRALAGFEGNEIPAALLDQWSKLPADLRKEVVVLLSSKKAWAAILLDAMKKGVVARQELNENDARRILAHKDGGLTKQVEEQWGKLREQTPANVEQQLKKFRGQLAELPGDRQAGRAVFEKSCMVCHKLFGQGNEVGPDLTGANRRDLEYLLTNILDPNRVVGKDYYRAVVLDKSGRVHTGLLAEDAPQRLVLKGENAKLTVIPKNEVEEFKLEEKSLMPEGLPESMTEVQLRDLIAFLLEEPHIGKGRIAGPFKMSLDFEPPLEKAADPLKADGVVWKPFQLGPAAVIDMEKLGVLAPPTDSTAYVLAEVKAPREMRTTLEVAADEDVKVWLNGKQVHRRMRAGEPARIEIDLKEGANRLMFKVHNVYGPSWLRARIGDPERVLEVR